MRGLPGFLSTLQTQLESLPIEVLERVNRPGGLEVRDLFDFLLKPRDFTVHMPDEVPESAVVPFHDIPEENRRLGSSSLEDGTTAVCILAGGAGTRVGTTKGLLRLPGSDTTLLGLKILQTEGVRHVWVMTSPTNHAAVKKHLEDIGAIDKVKIFSQYESLRLTPDNQLFFQDGTAELHPCGHGDLIPALINSGILPDFVAGGGRRMMVVNVDNVFGTPNPQVIGQHISAGRPVSVEVVERLPSEPGGVLCRHGGFDQVVELFRMSGHTDLEAFKWLNTNTMVIDADLDFSAVKWSWHRVKKIVDNKSVVQYERLLQDLTSHYQTQFIGVSRSSRFMPVKTPADLQEAARIFGRKGT